MKCCDLDCPADPLVIVRCVHEDYDVLLPMCIACSIVATSEMPELEAIRRVPSRVGGHARDPRNPLGRTSQPA